MKKEDTGLLLLRLGLGGVFVLFGIDKFFHPEFWSVFMPEWFFSFLPVEVFTFIYLLGVFEIIVGSAVLIGFYTKISAVICAAFLLGIIASLGFNDVMIRDAGLLFLALGIASLGAGSRSLDNKFRKV